MIERYSRPAMAAIWSEDHKLAQWLRVEGAVSEAWAAEGVVPESALESIRAARVDLARVAHHFQATRHDVNAFLRAVGETMDEQGRQWLHYGLTSNDVIDTAQSLQMVGALDLLSEDLQELGKVLERQAVAHAYTLMVGRTHGVHADPTSFGLKMLLWLDEVRRHLARLGQLRERVAVGKISGAVGTHANVPPSVEERACAALGLAPAPVSTQILQRDRHAEFVTTLALVAGSLEKFATEVRNLQRTEILEVEEPFHQGQTGSSAMPHKRNPELSERVTGLSRVMRGYAVSALENISLWHERDLSNSSLERVVLPDASLLLDYMLATFTYVMDGLQVYPERMRRNLEITRGTLFSQRVLLALVERGLERPTAYGIVQPLAQRAWIEGLSFRDLLRADPQVRAQLSEPELDALFDTDYHLRYVEDAFRRLGVSLPPEARP